MFGKFMLWLGAWSPSAIGVFWVCADCGCLMETEDDPEIPICDYCLSGAEELK